MKKKLKDPPACIQCRILAVKARNLSAEIFNEQDAPPYDGRIVANKERALERCLDRIAELSGIDKDVIRPFIQCWFWPYPRYFEALRKLGVPIANDAVCLMYECMKAKTGGSDTAAHKE